VSVATSISPNDLMDADMGVFSAIVDILQERAKDRG
jgi:hypothetical protein